MVHKTELSWDYHSQDPHLLVKVGDSIRAKIQAIDVAKKKIAASVKGLTEDPWTVFSLEPGDVLDVVIANKANFGYFVKVTEGVEGLLHNNDLAWNKQDKQALMGSLSIGDTTRVVVLEIDREKHRLAFSLKHLTPQPGHSA